MLQYARNRAEARRTDEDRGANQHQRQKVFSRPHPAEWDADASIVGVVRLSVTRLAVVRTRDGGRVGLAQFSIKDPEWTWASERRGAAIELSELKILGETFIRGPAAFVLAAKLERAATLATASSEGESR